MNTKKLMDLLNDWRACVGESPATVKQLYIEMLEAYMDDITYFEKWVCELQDIIDSCEF